MHLLDHIKTRPFIKKMLLVLVKRKECQSLKRTFIEYNQISNLPVNKMHLPERKRQQPILEKIWGQNFKL